MVDTQPCIQPEGSWYAHTLSYAHRHRVDARHDFNTADTAVYYSAVSSALSSKPTKVVGVAVPGPAQPRPAPPAPPGSARPGTGTGVGEMRAWTMAHGVSFSHSLSYDRRY